MNAIDDLKAKLKENEIVEAVVFGNYGWDGYLEDNKFVPDGIKGKVLNWNDAQQYMKGWSFNGGYGAPKCYAIYIWTNLRIFWVTQYDGFMALDSAPRNPTDIIPNMPGG